MDIEYFVAEGQKGERDGAVVETASDLLIRCGDLAATRGNRAFGPRVEQPTDPVQRAQCRADRLAARSVALRRYADALAPLYQGFDESQKRRFDILSRVERRRPSRSSVTGIVANFVSLVANFVSVLASCASLAARRKPRERRPAHASVSTC